jgi:serine/threonine protein phosphatase PrpC
MYYKIASLVLNSGQKNNSIADVFIAQPDSAKEALVGKIFVLVEIESLKTDGAKLLDFLVNNINYNYYQNEKVILRERIETISIESIFESALAKTNKDLVEFLTKEKIKISPYSINMTVCLLYQNELYFSNVGKNKCLLLHKEKVAAKTTKGRVEAEGKIEYKLSNIDIPPENDNEALTMNKLFSEVMGGKIPPGGYFLIINEALSEYLSSKQLIDITSRLSPAGAVEQIRNLLEKINSYVSFLGVIVKNTSSIGFSGEELKKQIDDEIKNWDYKPEIVSTEERTEAILTPAGTINLKRWFKVIAAKMAPKKKSTAPSPTPLGKKAGKIFMLKDKIFVKKRVSALSPDKLILLIKKIGALSARGITSLAAKREVMSDVKDNSLAAESVAKDRSFLAKNGVKLFFFAAIILIVLITANTLISQKKQETEQRQASFNSLIAEIDKNQNRIDSLLIYDNNNEARQIWDANKSLLTQIPAEEKENRNDIASLFSKQEEQLLRIRKIKTISELKKIADFSNLNKEAKPENVVILDGRLYAASPQEKAIYKVDIKDGLVTASYDLAGVERMDHPSVSADGIVYLDKDAVVLMAKNGSFQRIAVKNPPENIGGAGTYGNRLYLTDRIGGQIWRYTKTEEGFSSPEEWLDNKSDLSLASDMFIDGNIYILNSNGTIDKYLKGKKEVFSLSSVDEAILDAGKLMVGENGFYIFESSSKRLIRFDAKGQFTGQYIFQQPQNITDISVDDEEQVFILSEQSIYQASLQ